MAFKSFVGKNPPEEIKLMLKFNPLKSLTFDKENKTKISIVNDRYIKNNSYEVFLMFASGFKLLFGLSVILFNL